MKIRIKYFTEDIEIHFKEPKGEKESKEPKTPKEEKALKKPKEPMDEKIQQYLKKVTGDRRCSRGKQPPLLIILSGQRGGPCL